MAKSKKRKVHVRKLVVIGLLFLLVIIFACFLKRTFFPRIQTYYMTENWNGDPNTEFQKKAPKRDWYCPDLHTVITKAQKQVPIERIEVANKNNRSFQLVMKLSDVGPYLGLDADESVLLKLKPNSLTGFRSAFANRMLPKFIERGFVIEPKAQTSYMFQTFGSGSLPSDEEKDVQYFHSGIKKDGYVYILRYEDNEQHSISIDCGKIDDQDSQSLSLISSIIPFSEWKANTLIKIWGQLANNVIKLDIGQIEGGGGHGEWWMRNRNNSWTLLTAQQDFPECSIFESRKVGKGIECIRKNVRGEYEESKAVY